MAACTSRHSSSTEVVLDRLALSVNAGALLTLTCLLCCSCSLAFDASAKQCNVDADCAARGLANTVCVAQLCQPHTPAAGSGTTSSATQGTGGVTAGRSAPSASQAGAGGMAIAAGGRAAPVTAGTAAADDDAGVSVGGAGKAGAGGCTGQTCPECVSDQDCVRLGVVSGTCVASRCFAPQSQCNADADCASRGPEYVGGRCVATQCRPNPKWRCEPPPPPPQPGVTAFTIPIVDALSRAMVPNVHVVACNKLDVMCTQQVADGTTGSDGRVKITVPANFMGYFQVTERRDYAPAMYFLPTTVPANGVLPNFPLLASGAIINALAAGLGAGLDPTRGHMMLIANDCATMTVGGVKFASPQSDRSTVQFYVRDQLPSPMAMDTPPTGEGGYLNFPAGTALITATEAKSGLELATVSVLVRPGFITVSYILPMQRVQN